MPDDKTKMDEAETGQDNQAEAEQKAALMREIMTALDGLSPGELEQVYTALILLFARRK